MQLNLVSLPDDALIEILKQQHTISDALHLGRCCQRLYDVIDQNRLVIMKSIIVRSCFFMILTYSFRGTYAIAT